MIIHIGLPKTGTSFLQRHYFPNLQKITYWSDRNIYSKFGSKEIMSANLLLSSESLSGEPWNAQWLRGIQNDHRYFNSFETSISNLKRLFPEAHVVIVFRKHGEFLGSLYKQYIQEGGILPLEKFYNEHGVINDGDLNFTARINLIKNSFVKCSFLSFEEFKEEGVQYFDRFFGRLGCEIEEQVRNISANKSISGRKIDLLRYLNHYYPKLSIRFQNLLNKNQLTPRKLLQARLRFWQPEDSEIFNEFMSRINRQFEDDWKNVEKHFFRSEKF